MLIPKALKKGDTIGIVSPSGAIVKQNKKQLNSGIKFLKNLGFKTLLGKNALKVDNFSAGTAQERADDINNMFSDSSVDAIMCTQGGETANSCLPFIDWSIIRKNPKIFTGISDITALLNAMYTKSSLVSFHGNDVMWGFGRKPSKYDTNEFIGRLVNKKIGLVNKNSIWKTVKSGSAEGTLLGGNLTCFMKLIGTEYFPDLTNSILFLEEYRPRPQELEYKLEQLKQTGVFEKVKGVLIGHIDGIDNKNIEQNMESILLRITGSYDFPILKCHDFGHNCPNTVLPLGIKVKLDAGSNNLEILENCVR
ncbi:MAG: LD-carboxypeptidase [Candidatus Aenigmarchaeota archaeon]|nr:LD-carboxypeptidase [Candidatus Aenigmarchaeota archaeon]